jgi:hypothetical protein
MSDNPPPRDDPAFKFYLQLWQFNKTKPDQGVGELMDELAAFDVLTTLLKECALLSSGNWLEALADCNSLFEYANTRTELLADSSFVKSLSDTTNMVRVTFLVSFLTKIM